MSGATARRGSTEGAGGARAALVLAALAAVAATGCLGSAGSRRARDRYPRYAKYRHRAEARQASEALLAAIPVYPGAHEASGEFEGTGSYVGKNDETIEAEPSSLGVYYRVPVSPTGTKIMRFLRRVLPVRGWHCAFTPRSHGVRRASTCSRGHQVIGGSVNDSGAYGMRVTPSDIMPPIETVPQVE